MTGLSIIVFMLILLSGPIFLLLALSLKIEDTLPICSTLIVFSSFVLGIVGLLKYSIYIILVISLILFIFSFYITIKSKCFKETLNKIFTPGFIIYLILCMIFLYTTKGKLFSTWDEFSHWGDIVKVMTTLNDFGTNSNSMSIFPSYPPGMALFQYSLERINYIISGNPFVEWLTYYAYYIFMVSYLIPFTKKLSFRKVSNIILFVVIIICIPFMFFNGMYYEIYIDPFLSFLFAAGLLHLLFDQNNKMIETINLCSILFMLVLAKDVGLLFAIMLFIFFTMKLIILQPISIKEKAIYCILSIVFIVLPKALWQYNLKINRIISSFGSKIDFADLWNVLIGYDMSYRSKVLQNYFFALSNKGIVMNFLELTVPYITLLFIIVFLLLIVMRQNKNKISVITCLCAFSTCAIYILGMCIIYMYKFSEYEALRLASFNRYLDIIFMSLFLFLFISFIISLKNTITDSLFVISTLITITLFCPINNVEKWINKQIIFDSVSFRNRYEPLVNETRKYSFDRSRIYFISQESDGFDQLIYRYSVRPNRCSTNYSIGKKFYDGDIYTTNKTADEWIDELIENFDFVALFNLNSYFYENFYYLFENPDDISNNRIYRIDKTWRVLVLCE